MDSKPGAQRLVLTVEEAGELLGLGRNQAYEAVKRGEIPSFRIGKRILVPRDGLEQLVNGTVVDWIRQQRAKEREGDQTI